MQAMRTQQIYFAIQGMFCAKCAVQIERALARLDGVVSAQVNYASERARVVYDPDRIPAVEMIGAVRGEGFAVALQHALVPLNVALREAGSAFLQERVVRASLNWDASNVEIEWLADSAGAILPRLSRRFLIGLMIRSLGEIISTRKENSVTPRLQMVLSVLEGIVGFFALFAIYIGIVSLAARDFAHAFELLAQDKWLVGAIALGFGTQIGLFAFLRLGVSVGARSAMMATGAGTSTSTLSMIACCAHHVTDVAPIVGLAGFTSAASFLTENKSPIMFVGLAMNLVGIVITFRAIRQSRAHLNALGARVEAAPICH